MPPKRKHEDDNSAPADAASIRSTRHSTRSKAAVDIPAASTVKKTTAKKKAKASSAAIQTPDTTESLPRAKKSKTQANVIEAEPNSNLSSSANKEFLTNNGVVFNTKSTGNANLTDSLVHSTAAVSISQITSTNGSMNGSDAAAALRGGSASTSVGVYSPTEAKRVFDTYADEDERDVISPEGYTRLCGDAGIDLEGALPLVLSWQLAAKEMAKISRNEWEAGTAGLRVSSLATLRIALQELADLLLTDAAPISTPPSAFAPNRGSIRNKGGYDEPYDRSRYHAAAVNRKAAFSELYGYCFNLAKPEGSRNIDMEVAGPFWTVLLGPRYPIINDIVEFVNEKENYNRVNKDLWTMVLEFCETVSPSLDNYEADGAWPTMIDEFVEWKKAKMG